MGLMEKLCQGVVDVAEEAEKVARIGLLNTEIISFKEQKGRIFREIGQRIITVYTEGGRTNPDFDTEWAKIQGLDAEIAQREADIEETKSAGKRPSSTEQEQPATNA